MQRIIFSIQLTLKPPSDGEVVQLIAVLDRDGQSKDCRAVPPKQRVIDLRIGDQVWFEDAQHEILNVTAFRETNIEPELLGEIADGYLVQTG
jgi:hypothetical protein